MGCPAAAERVCLRSRSRRCYDAACPCFARSGCSSCAHDVYATGRALLRQEARPFSALAALISSASDRANLLFRLVVPQLDSGSGSNRLHRFTARLEVSVDCRCSIQTVSARRRAASSSTAPPSLSANGASYLGLVARPDLLNGL